VHTQSYLPLSTLPLAHPYCWTSEKLTDQTEAGSSKIPVGQIIAVLAEEGEDLASLEIPKDLSPPGSSSSSAAPAKEAEAEAPKAEKAEKKKVDVKQGSSGAPASSSSASSSSGGAASHGHGHKEIKHAKPIFPSVSRLYVSFHSTLSTICISLPWSSWAVLISTSAVPLTDPKPAVQMPPRAQKRWTDP
jgi:hypothetical protein